MKFNVTESKGCLTIEQTPSSLLGNSTKQILMALVTAFIIFSFPRDQLLDISSFLQVIYLIPAILIYRLIKSFKNQASGLTFKLDKNNDSLFKNGVIIDRLKNIDSVEWNIDSPLSHEFSYLELRSNSKNKHRISTTKPDMNQEHETLGKTLAAFLKVNFVNNNPIEKEVLYYGENDVDESDLGFLEGRV